MHPPWITFSIFLFLLTGNHRISGQPRESEEDEESKSNLTVTRAQREILERERRLIPYMTYYLNQGLNRPTSVRQNVLIPVSTPRENVLQLTTVPQIATNNIAPQRFEVRPNAVAVSPAHVLISPPVVQERIQNAPRGEGLRVLGQIYKLEPGVNPYATQQNIRPQVVNVSPAPQAIRPKYLAPQTIKYVPIIVKSSPETGVSKAFTSSQPRYPFATTKLPALPPATYTNDQNYYDRPVTPLLQRNKVYEVNLQNTNLEKDKYAVAKILIGSTSAPHYATGVKINLGDAGVVGYATQTKQTHPVDLTVTATGASGPTTETHFVAAQDPQQLYQGERNNREREKQIADPETGELVATPYVERIPRLKVPHEDDIKFVASVTPVSDTNDLGSAIKYTPEQPKESKVSAQSTLDNLLSVLKETEKLPQTLTPENIDTGIKALALILERLQQQKYNQEASKAEAAAQAPKAPSHSSEEYKKHTKVHSFPQPSGTSTPGRPGIDYPTYSSIPRTNFDCSTQRYKGFFGDPDTKCQVWHYCDLNGGQASFLCPNGTIFSQVALTCDWWFNVKCASTSQLYVLNERLYKYILPFSPSFPEDYSGPIVDTYLTAKFKEMEAKSKSKALKQTPTTKKPETTTSEPLHVPTEQPGEEPVTVNLAEEI